MRRLALAGLAFALLPAPSAHAAIHTLHAECDTAWFLLVGRSVAFAVSGGDVRGVHTEVTCTWYPWNDPTPQTWHAEAPGPVAVTPGGADGGELGVPYLCVSAYAFWADGESHTTETVCTSTFRTTVDWTG